jgi:AraC-like DNA-binding protein/quercetin dioxygenase-like cupin family protein
MGANQPFRELLPLNDEEVIIISDHITAAASAPLHFHPEYELVLFLNCKGLEFEIGTVKEKANDTELVLIAPNVPHSWKFNDNPNNNARILTINFNEQFLIHTSKKKDNKGLICDGFSTILFSAKTAHHLSEKLTGTIKLKKKNCKTTLKAILRALMQSTDKRTIFADEKAVGTLEINLLDKYLKASYNSRLKLSDVCGFTGMSQASFNRYINKYTGQSFIAYFNNIKLAFSARYLSETDEKVAVIAVISGFNNLANFNRTFKNRYGITPLRYRELYFGRKYTI